MIKAIILLGKRGEDSTGKEKKMIWTHRMYTQSSSPHSMSGMELAPIITDGCQGFSGPLPPPFWMINRKLYGKNSFVWSQSTTEIVILQVWTPAPGKNTSGQSCCSPSLERKPSRNCGSQPLQTNRGYTWYVLQSTSKSVMSPDFRKNGPTSRDQRRNWNAE